MEQVIADDALKAVLIASALLIILAALCLKIKDLGPTLKKVLYILIVGVTILTTLFLGGSTIYLNVKSSSGGPVHWHADYEIYSCGKEMEMEKPHGMSNKVGESTLHQHGDNKIHLEGVVVEKNDASLGKFFKAVGGQITDKNLIVSTDEGKKSFISGQTCPDGKVAQVQVFVYKVEEKNYSQKKISNPENYVISPQSNVPPGDCIIIEFDTPEAKTDKLCRSFKVAKQIGKLGEEIP